MKVDQWSEAAMIASGKYVLEVQTSPFSCTLSDIAQQADSPSRMDIDIDIALPDVFPTPDIQLHNHSVRS